MNKILFLDNQDSFTYNLVEELYKLSFDVEVYRNTIDAGVIIEKILRSVKTGEAPLLFLSPGPGTPDQAGCMMSVLDAVVGQVPVLGICLGHQAIAQQFGGEIIGASETVHGKSSVIKVENHPIFDGLGKQVQVARYHSLIATNLPKDIQVLGHFDGMPMCILQEEHRALGFQFHPESILTTQGSILIKQSIQYLTAKQ